MFRQFLFLAGGLFLGLMPALAVPAKLGDLDEDGVPTVADLNGDGAVNDLDLDEVVKEILGTRTPRSLPLARIRGTNPSSGEGDVSLNRETVLHFSMPLAVDVVLDTNQLYAWFGGRRLLARVEVSSDRLKATLFYWEPLPSSARVRVFLEAPGLKDVLGRDVDLDGDGVAGGSYYLTFDTLSVTPVLATAISGKVFASERGSGGAEVPLAGVTITVDGAEQEIRTVTDAAVNFTLTPLSGWQFFYDDRRPDLPRRRLAGRQLLSFRRETLGSRRRPRGQLRRQYRGHSPEWKYLPSPVPQWRPSEM